MLDRSFAEMGMKGLGTKGKEMITSKLPELSSPGLS
jgi:hypothetical protein